MFDITDYKLNNILYKGKRYAIYEGNRKSDNQGMIFKTLSAEISTYEQIEVLKNEYRLLTIIDNPNVIKAIEVLEHGSSPIMIMESIEGESLANILKKRRLSLTEFLNIAIDLTNGIRSIHIKGIVHKNINLDNIFWDEKNKICKFLDFSMATDMPIENMKIENINLIEFEGDLAFMSPEQTRRVNRTVDYRTDYYSLGVVFYSMITNIKPFVTNDVSEMVHCHLAKKPVPPHEVDNKIPEVISDIIIKLLSKPPEERYQSIEGLKYDLEKCFSTLKDNKIKYFKVASQDVSKRFNIPELLYGRKEEITELFEAYEKCTKGRKKILFFTGPGGVGKTSIVNEIKKTVIENNGFFINGKYDYQAKGIPYSAIIQAFDKILSKILLGPENQQQELKDQLIDALGSNGQIMIDIIPVLGDIIGKQTAVPILPPVESQNRFNHVFQSFFKVFASKKHPLIFFLDDLQWADKASLDLIQAILVEENLHHCLFIGAFRNDESESMHLIHKMLDTIRKENVDWIDIAVKALDENYTGQLVSNVLNRSLSESIHLGQLIYNKTKGNPFFIKEFLKILHSSNLIKFKENEEYPEYGWDWNISEIQQENISDDIISLMVKKIEDLPQATIKILKTCSCLGIRFDLDLLSVITQETPSAILENLRIALNEGMLIKEKNYIYFIHDRVLEAVYFLITTKEKAEIHYNIGKSLQALLTDKSTDDQVFNFVQQWNRVKKILNEKEKQELIRLNYQAGIAAKKSTAYDAAASYFQNASEILPDNLWKENYPFAFLFYKEWSETEYLARNFNKAEKLFEKSLSQINDILDKKEIYAIMIRHYVTQMKPLEALEVGINTLKQLGITVPKKPTMLSVVKEFMKSKILIGRRKTADLIRLPLMQEKRFQAAAEIMMICVPPALIANPNLAPVLILKIVNLSLKNGIAAASTTLLINYGAILWGPLGDLKKGLEFGELGKALQKKYNIEESRVTNLFVYNISMMHFKMSFKERQENLAYTMEQCLNVGNLEYYGYTVNDYNWSSLFCGENLHVLLAQLAKYQKKVYQLKQPQTNNYYNMFYQSIENLAGRCQSKLTLIGEQFNEEITLPILVEKSDNAGQTWFNVLKMILHYYLGNHKKGVEFGQKSEKGIDGLLGMPIILIYHFYYALLLSSVILENEKTNKKMFSKLRKIERKYKKWSDANPTNYLNKYLLICALISRIQGKKFEDTAKLYDEAIKSSAKFGFIHEEAIANELAAEYYLSVNLDEMSKTYMGKAFSGYIKWGCQPKADALKEQYPELNPLKSIDLPQGLNYGYSGGEAQINLSTMDLNSILKTSYAISQEINLEGILKKLMKIVAENAGAEKGYFLLPKNDKWLIEAAYIADSNDILVMQSIPIIQPNDIPLLSTGILDYVATNKRIIVLDHAANENRFKDDFYIQMYKTKSILCIPLLKQGRMIGIAYLENNLLTGSFTRERIDILQLLSGHIAVSISNALLYENLDNKVRERTGELEIERNKLQEKNNTMEQDITLARKIQFNLIPQNFDVDYISHVYQPMEELGGDFFDIIKFKDSDKIGIFVSDVSGHGVTAAFITSMIKTIILQAKEVALNPAGLLSHMNDVLWNMTSGNFVTVFYGIYDPRKRTLLYSNAGHNHPYLIVKNGITSISGGKSTAIAILPSERLKHMKQEFQNCEHKLPGGAKLFIYTDGLTEATPLGSSNSFEGDELNRHILKHRDLPAFHFTSAIYSELIKFRGSESFDDDVCFLCLDIPNRDFMKNSYKTEGIEIRNACLDVENLFNEWGIDEIEIQDMSLAIDEALTNIKEHGYKDNIGLVRLEVLKEPSDVKITITDNAQPYYIDHGVAFDKSTYVDSDRIGGFGITIIKTLMDSVKLSRYNDENILFMSKNVNYSSI